MEEYVEGEEFVNQDCPPRGSYENCQFRKCSWHEKDLSRYTFIDCEFTECDLTMTKMNNTVLNGVLFTGCKLTGIRFDYADKHLFDVLFRDCIMHLTSFYDRSLPETTFTACELLEADFTGANLSDIEFDECNLDQAIFRDCTLRGTDFRTALNVSLELTENEVRGANFRADQLPSLVSSFGLVIEH